MSWFNRFRHHDARSDTQDTQKAGATDSAGYILQGGRRRLAAAPYQLPTDMLETNRLDFQHYMLRYAMRGIYAAPLERPGGILDVGCGTGRWALEMATIFPDANVVGVDITPPAIEDPTTLAGFQTRPDNFAFIQTNILDTPLPFADNTFDFTHMRLLFLAIPANRWQDVVRELVRVTRPGGWVELVEGGFSQDVGPVSDRFNHWMDALSRKRGIDISQGARVGEFLSEAGLVGVQTRTVALPIGSWGGRAGQMMESDILAVGAAMRGVIIASGLATEEGFDATTAGSRAELASDQYRSTFPFYVAYGQKL